MKEVEKFNHFISVDQDLCIGCSHCVRVCPTEALRVWGGKAILEEAKCVDCGDCVRVCPVMAIGVEHHSINAFSKDDHNMALIPSVFWGQFPADISRNRIINAILALGFKQVVEAEESVEPLSSALNTYVAKRKGQKIISSFCPAIIRLIQTRFPELVSSIALLKSPVELTALHISRKMKKENGRTPAALNIFYISPCAAKAAAIENIKEEIDFSTFGVINMDVFFNAIQQQLNKKETVETNVEEDLLTAKSIGWSLKGGESNHLSGQSLSIDGMKPCVEILENIENDRFKEIDFLELKACDQGCAGGVLTPQNKFLCVESLKKRMENKKESPSELILNNKDFELSEIKEMSVLALDINPAKSLKMLNKTRRMMCYLPGFDCGACGAPSCKALAEDVAKGNAILSHCVFMQRQMEKHHRLSPDHAFNIIESIWGKDRLNKDCNKKGAINDSK
ncbi:MAG: ferredoxin [Bacteroidetes bacterium 4572_77]|nr:MAG: ferredoxin [Bacteroidetes bacterium 4572_77]